MNRKYTKKGFVNKEESIVPKKKKALKTAALTVVSVFAVLAVLCGVLFAINERLKKNNAHSNKTEASDNANKNADGKNYINYYIPDYDADIFEDEDYLEKNRKIRFFVQSEDSNTSLVLDEYENSELTQEQRFFKKYFKAVTEGDADTYHKMFTEEYVKNPNGFENHPSDRVFPMQRLYDISVKELIKTDNNDATYKYYGAEAVYGVYEVSYKILKNDGEFRYDLPEDAEIPMIMELVTTGVGTDSEKTLINNIYRYSDIKK